MKQENENTFTHLGLFEGIGGFSLAARWMGWETLAYSEINPFCLKVLKHHFPKADVLTDIKTTDFKPYANRIDIITGGFPCQPYSVAGKRKGKEDERHLWPEMLRAIREVKPTWVVGENVYGLINWDGGLVFDEVQTDLESEGYQVQAYVLPACGVNSPHKRDRLWVVAHSNDKRQPEQNVSGKSEKQKLTNRQFNEHEKSIANTLCIRQSGQGWAPEQMRSKTNGNWQASWINSDGGWPIESPICGRTNGFSGGLDRLKSLGNAIVPQVALQIFKSIEQYENETPHG